MFFIWAEKGLHLAIVIPALVCEFIAIIFGFITICASLECKWAEWLVDKLLDPGSRRKRWWQKLLKAIVIIGFGLTVLDFIAAIAPRISYDPFPYSTK